MLGLDQLGRLRRPWIVVGVAVSVRPHGWETQDRADECGGATDGDRAAAIRHHDAEKSTQRSH
jgi:hypothetical protein